MKADDQGSKLQLILTFYGYHKRIYRLPRAIAVTLLKIWDGKKIPSPNFRTQKLKKILFLDKFYDHFWPNFSLFLGPKLVVFAVRLTGLLEKYS